MANVLICYETSITGLDGVLYTPVNGFIRMPIEAMPRVEVLMGVSDYGKGVTGAFGACVSIGTHNTHFQR